MRMLLCRHRVINSAVNSNAIWEQTNTILFDNNDTVAIKKS